LTPEQIEAYRDLWLNNPVITEPIRSQINAICDGARNYYGYLRERVYVENDRFHCMGPESSYEVGKMREGLDAALSNAMKEPKA
jgi:hypothetical protein